MLQSSPALHHSFLAGLDTGSDWLVPTGGPPRGWAVAGQAGRRGGASSAVGCPVGHLVALLLLLEQGASKSSAFL